MIPDPLVQAILSQVQQPRADERIAHPRPPGEDEMPPKPGSLEDVAGRTKGEETYIYLWSRLYTNFTDSKAYFARSIPDLERDPRVIELRFLLKWLRAWHTYNKRIETG
eukprot:scaffold3178_cov109-Isochrysis_galbana.AAC.6